MVALWAVFVHHNVDKAKWWWEQAGVHPLQIHRLKEFTDRGFAERDLGVVIDGGKTVLEHLLAGQNVKWCVDSLVWHNRSQRL
ncbi:hypothetical protein GCM10022252_62250 [Streptosporangium oxazolinicum]|uniref:Uncharacterized protein n=1 Tax=Streptosporangium oxazolinicum TaxID=909287 RepID=A0ABP8BD86_9ACTN